MARKKIREYHSKVLIKRVLPDLTQLPQLQSVLVTADTNWKQLKKDHAWLSEYKLVAKPDMMFGQRAKHGLVLLDSTLEQVEEFVTPWFETDKTIDIHGVNGSITHFLIEPFVPHNEEFYFSINAERENTIIRFCLAGGIDIESSWHENRELHLPVGDSLDSPEHSAALEHILSSVPEHLRAASDLYIRSMLRAFETLDFLTLETNPFTFIEHEGVWRPLFLDMVAEIDDTAKFKNRHRWADLEFPDVFGRKRTKEERFIEELDEKTGASLKLTLLNPQGRIWNLVAGGGASVIFADTVADLGYGHLLGNYGEYSGAPNEEETYHYARTVLDLATRHAVNDPSQQRTALLIGGGIANFTDVAQTFKGIVHALKEYRDRIQRAKMQLFVRRAGPNYQSGLKLIRNVCNDLDIPVQVFGPEKNMTEIIPLAIAYIEGTSN